MSEPQKTSATSRRGFLKGTAVAVTGSTLAGTFAPPVHAGHDETIKIALIGCGARGAGAAVQALSTEGPVRLWAMADAFQDRLETCLTNLKRGVAASYDREATGGLGEQVDVPKERQFVGLDAYRHAIDSGVDVVLLTEPPGFRPKHLAYAIEAGKHVFMEKPVATDVAGIQRVLRAAEVARQKNLKIGVGLQRHHHDSYQAAMEQVREGALGDLQMLRCYWNGGPPAKTPIPREEMTELEYQVRNWYFFSWLSGDHICEQHVHNIDVCNWIKGEHPVEAQGQGGRQVRTGKQYGDIFDHHMVEFTFADGTKMFSQCRQIRGCWNAVAESAHGLKGTLNLGSIGADIHAGKKRVWRWSRPRGEQRRNPYQVEHDVLFDAIRNDTFHNEAEYGAISTMTAILGRMATYSGRVVKWDEAMSSGLQLTIDAEQWDATPPVTADPQGHYPVAVPGETTFV